MPSDFARLNNLENRDGVSFDYNDIKRFYAEDWHFIHDLLVNTITTNEALVFNDAGILKNTALTYFTGFGLSGIRGPEDPGTGQAGTVALTLSYAALFSPNFQFGFIAENTRVGASCPGKQFTIDNDNERMDLDFSKVPDTTPRNWKYPNRDGDVEIQRTGYRAPGIQQVDRTNRTIEWSGSPVRVSRTVLPGDTLDENGERVKYEAFGTFNVDSSETGDISIEVSGTIIAQIPFDDADTTWRVELDLEKVASFTQICNARIFKDDAVVCKQVITAEDNSADMYLEIWLRNGSGTPGLQQRYSSVEWQPYVT